MKQSKRVIAIVLALVLTSLEISADLPENQPSGESTYELKGYLNGSPSPSKYISPDGSRIISIDKKTGDILYIQLTTTGELLKSFKHKKPITWAQWISANQIIFSYRDDEGKVAVSIWNI